MSDNIGSGIIRLLGNALHGVIQWVDINDTIGSWLQRNSTEEGIALQKKLASIQNTTNSQIDKLRQTLTALQTAGVSMSPAVTKAINEKIQKLQKQIEHHEGDKILIDEASDTLNNLYSGKRQLGDVAAMGLGFKSGDDKKVEAAQATVNRILSNDENKNLYKEERI